MKIQWELTTSGNKLVMSGQEVGYFQIPDPRKPLTATFQIGTQIFTITRPGFWKTRVCIYDENGHEIMHLKPKNWWFNSMVFTYLQETYVIRLKNSPLVTWIIENNGISILEYGLAVTSKGNGLKIKCDDDVPVLFHGLLWYFMHTVLQEQNGFDDGSLIVVLV
ncbi:MAG: hypothetical protein RL607_2300 [Bacteroidota bacterium]|jgi:hypothetical protein